MDDQAIPSDMPAFSTLTEAIAEPSAVFTEKEKMFHALFSSPAWAEYEAVIKEKLDDLRKMSALQREGLHGKVSPEEIGKQFIINNLAADLIDETLLDVKLAAEAIDANAKRQRERVGDTA